MSQQYLKAFYLAIFSSLQIIAIPMATAAEQFPQEDLLSLSLEDLMRVQVTSSTLTDKNIRTVPSSITIFTYQQIQSMGVDTLEELLNFVTGFQSFRQADASNEYYHSVRGRRTGTASREVLVLIDGQRFNQEYTAATGTPMIGLTNIEKVEIIRGPGSAIYGSNAFTGVINITTRKDKNEIKLSDGSDKHQQGSLLYSGKQDDLTLNIYANAFNDNGEAYRLENPATHLFYDSRDPYQGYDLNIKLGAPNKELNIIHSKQQASEFYVFEQSSNQYNEKDQQYSSLQFQQTLVNDSPIATHYRLRYYQWSTFLQLPVGPTKANADFKENAIEFNIHNNWTISSTHSLQFGAEQRHINNEKAESNSDFGSSLINDAATRNVTGLYLQNQNALSDNTDLTLGVRYDHYSSMTSAVSPRFALIHQLSNTQTIKLLYGNAFRAPAFGEFSVTSNVVGVGNPDLKPETISTWELVWIGSWRACTIGVTAFNSQVKDSIIQGFNEALRQYVNADSTEKSQGIEMGGLIQLTPQWQVRAQYSLFGTLPDSAFRQADNVASLILNYQNNKWNFNISSNYAGERKMLLQDDQLALDSYWLMNAKLQYIFYDTTKIYVQAKNLTNKDYLTPAQGEFFTVGIPNRGREISIGMQYGF